MRLNLNTKPKDSKRKCLLCGKDFEAKTKDHKFCGGKCKQKANNINNRENYRRKKKQS